VLFNSPIFFFFLALLLPVYALTKGDRRRQFVLLIFSYWFYAQWNWHYLALLVSSSLIDFTAARAIFKHKDSAEYSAARRRKLYLVVSLCVNLGLLAVFKYGRLLLDTIGLDGSFLPREIPPGISFYTFQTMSYTIDVYLRRAPPERDLVDYLLYVTFFPQLVAGPIVRATEFLPQTRPMPDLRLERIAEGFQRFTLGMFKKVVIADQAGLFVNAVFLTPGREDAVHLWAAAYGFALIIYCDFSAYTDMALGLAHAFGFKLPENFNAPYLARSITEFWRRWHMTLSRWLRDYLYVPLGGNRDGELRTYRNLLLTMLLGGLWHGASWTFVAWGAWHGVLLAIERMCGVRADERAERSSAVGRLARTVLTFHLVVLGWVVFRAPSFTVAGEYLTRMFTGFDTAQVIEFGRQIAFGWRLEGASSAAFWTKALLLLVVAQWAIHRFDLKRNVWDRTPWLLQGVVLAALWLAVAFTIVDEVKFIYFQF
jgi:alginate O-acetyltransferase complex protein AlgI